jgi:hypothetical protein
LKKRPGLPAEAGAFFLCSWGDSVLSISMRKIAISLAVMTILAIGVVGYAAV